MIPTLFSVSLFITLIPQRFQNGLVISSLFPVVILLNFIPDVPEFSLWPPGYVPNRVSKWRRWPAVHFHSVFLLFWYMKCFKITVTGGTFSSAAVHRRHYLPNYPKPLKTKTKPKRKTATPIKRLIFWWQWFLAWFLFGNWGETAWWPPANFLSASFIREQHNISGGTGPNTGFVMFGWGAANQVDMERKTKHTRTHQGNTQVFQCGGLGN